MRKRDLARRLSEECEVVKRLEHQHYLDGLRIAELEHALRDVDRRWMHPYIRPASLRAALNEEGNREVTDPALD